MKELIARGLEALSIPCPADGAERLAEYGRLLLEKNQVMNLTAITQPRDVAALHMLDCAALLQYVDLENKTLIDVGTGAGFPGMVLKILVPSLQVTLLDSLNKRLDWLSEVAAVLGLNGVTTVHARGEEKAHDPGFREGFDFAAARAVADLSVLCELCLPYVKPGGQFLAMKSVDSDDELVRCAGGLTKLGGALMGSRDYLIPGTEVRHRLVTIEKTGGTPALYPRRWAKIQKSPL